MSFFCMKTRNCLLLLGVFFGSIIFSFMVIKNDPANSPTWNNIVSETQKQLNNLKKLNEKPGIHKNAETEPYLRKLGLEDDEKLEIPGNHLDLSATLPTIAIPVRNGEASATVNFLKSIRRWLKGYQVVVYDLGLGYFEKKSVRTYCNRTSGIRCSFRRFDWDLYPSHVSELKYGAYTPIIIQEILNKTGAVLYMTPAHRITSDNIQSALNISQSVGVAAWPLVDSTSSITHHKVYTFFHTDEKKFYFHRTVSPDRLIVYGRGDVLKQLMLPWLQCALTLGCIAPIGAQDTGCRTYRKPLFLYSGCHGYDCSIMNIVLGLMFQFDATPYSAEPAVVPDQSHLSKSEANLASNTHSFFVSNEAATEYDRLEAEKTSLSNHQPVKTERPTENPRLTD